MYRKDTPFPLVVVAIIVSILYSIFMGIQEEKLAAECPSQYYKTEIYPKEYKARLIKKNERDGEGMTKPGYPSVDLNNQGEILHIGISPQIFLDDIFDKKFWDYVEEGDSIIKAKNSYQLKVVRGNTVKIFELDCEQFKKELESKNK